MDNTIDRPVSPLYEAIHQDIRTGPWPEDEYDVADSPLSYLDYKSQVSVNAIEPILVTSTRAGGRYRHSGGTTDTDFESLKSDADSDWDAADDTMVTDIDIDIHEKPNTEKEVDLLAGTEGRIIRRSIVEEPFEGNGSGIAAIDAVVEKAIEGGEIEAIGGGEIASVIGTKSGAVLGIPTGFRAEIAKEVDNAFKSVTSEASTRTPTSTVNVEKEALEGTGAIGKPSQQQPIRLIIPDTLFGTQVQEVEPPPIPSRSPSRPGTALANRRPQVETPDIFSVSHAGGSTISLPPARLTVSSLSSPRSSRFFEDLADQATTTATSVEISSPLPPKRQESRDPTVNKVRRKGSQSKKLKKDKKNSTCGLKFRLWGKKSGKPKKSGSNDNARVASVKSTIKY